MERWSGRVDRTPTGTTPILHHSTTPFLLMKVFVTGASGFVGQELAGCLRQAGHSIRILARSRNSRRVQEVAARYQAEVHEGDVLDATSLDGALEGMAAVIHLVGIISEVGRSTFENVHTRGTQNMVAAAQRAGVGRFIQMSALGTRPNAISRYHQTKWAAEEAVRQSGLDFTIFRPSLIYGPRDQFVNLFAKIIRLSPILPVMGSKSVRFQPVSVQSVATAFAASLTETRAVGRTYDLCGPETFTLAEILDEILFVMGRRPLKLRVPLGLSRCQAAVLEFAFPRLLGRAPPLNRDQLIMLQEDNVGDARPANELFKLKMGSFREGIAGYLKRGR